MVNMAQPARDGARMSRRADALDCAVADIATNSRDDAHRQGASEQNRTLLDVQLEPSRKLFRIDKRLPGFDPVEVGPDLAHAIAERTIRFRCLHRKVCRAEPAEQRVRSHAGFAEACALLAAQRVKLA